MATLLLHVNRNVAPAASAHEDPVIKRVLLDGPALASGWYSEGCARDNARSQQAHAGAGADRLDQAGPDFADERFDVGLAGQFPVPQVEVDPPDEGLGPLAEECVEAVVGLLLRLP